MGVGLSHIDTGWGRVKPDSDAVDPACSQAFRGTSGIFFPVSSQRVACSTDCRHFIMVMLQQRKTSALEETLSDRVPNPHYDTLILANALVTQMFV